MMYPNLVKKRRQGGKDPIAESNKRGSQWMDGKRDTAETREEKSKIGNEGEEGTALELVWKRAGTTGRIGAKEG